MSSPPHSICHKMLDGNNYIIGKRVYHLPYGALIPNELDPPCIRCYLKWEDRRTREVRSANDSCRPNPYAPQGKFVLRRGGSVATAPLTPGNTSPNECIQPCDKCYLGHHD